MCTVELRNLGAHDCGRSVVLVDDVRHNREQQQWVFPQRFFRERLKLGEEGRDNDIMRDTFERTGSLEPVRAEPTQRVTHLT